MLSLEVLYRVFSRARMNVEFIGPVMKYPIETQSQPVSGIAALKLLEAIDSDKAVVNDRMVALAKRIAARRRHKALKNG